MPHNRVEEVKKEKEKCGEGKFNRYQRLAAASESSMMA